MPSTDSRRLVAGIVTAGTLGWSSAILAAPITSPLDLVGGTLINFEAYAAGTAGPITESGATVTGTPAGIAAIFDASGYTQFPGIVQGKIFGFTPGVTFNIVFDVPVARVGLGVFDPNYPAGSVTLVNTLNAYDAGGNLIESTASGSASFPVGPIGGVFSTYIGFAYATDTIKRIELVGAGSGEVLGIDNVSFARVPGVPETEVPEPGTIGLLLAGVAGLAGFARHRSQ